MRRHAIALAVAFALGAFCAWGLSPASIEAPAGAETAEIEIEAEVFIRDIESSLERLK